MAFGSVDEHGIAVWDEAGEEGLEIAADVRVGILLNQQGSGSVTEMKGKESVLKPFFGNPISDIVGNFVKTPAAGGNANFIKRLEHDEIRPLPRSRSDSQIRPSAIMVCSRLPFDRRAF